MPRKGRIQNIAWQIYHIIVCRRVSVGVVVGVWRTDMLYSNLTSLFSTILDAQSSLGAFSFVNEVTLLQKTSLGMQVHFWAPEFAFLG